MASVQLATPLSGGGSMTRAEGNRPVTKQLAKWVAAWQSHEKGVPKRVVIRCDGFVRDISVERDAGGSVVEYGFPCAVLNVRYTIGAYEREVMVDAVNQSALVVWAISVEVTPEWDERRISRLDTYDIKPSRDQYLAAAISECCGDEGQADARWLDMIRVDQTVLGPGEATFEVSIHPIPNGARGVRFLNATVEGDPVSVPDLAQQVTFVTDDQAWLTSNTGIVETAVDGLTNQSQIMVPAVARFLIVAFPQGTIETFDTPTWLEWILSPVSGVAF